MSSLAGRLASELGVAQAHRQLEDLKFVEEFECGGLPPTSVEREGGTRAGALPRESRRDSTRVGYTGGEVSSATYQQPRRGH